ncbi:TetR/AcrR family transcriptional regulator [Pelagibaculum spongiae]|uniref:TetR family transcriptional regulator n=1 Tax=Pelagibaculum spongiae TaxID=2080658 RepID=A0A2V1GT64_9GAMM|nr:TetR family transcriptional regulator [Pelagibaculum spongiae]PVZ68788.1 TetR family transcriptional regulator [Pelagibaculum spongiae]
MFETLINSERDGGGKATTKDRILDAAESLFAEKGFSETSLRGITNKAEVNLASVNYHFGDKKSLIQAVIGRRIDALMPTWEADLTELSKIGREVSLEYVLETIFRPILEMDQQTPGSATILMRLLGRAYSETQGHLRRFMQERYGTLLLGYYSLLSQSLPQLSPVELFWRTHFTLGTVAFTLASDEALKQIAESDYNESAGIESVIRRLVPYLANGLRAAS